MIVLLMGGSGRFMDAMISKFNKYGHRVYLVTGHRNNHSSYRRVFEKYDFSYDSDSLKEVFASTRPDLVVHMGAYDTNYDWLRSRQESVRYTADLMNILAAFSVVGKGRFVYLSTDGVYGKSYHDDIDEEEPVSAKTFQMLAVSQGEEICKSYHNSRDVDMLILRLDHLYGKPRKGIADSNPCFSMCLEALKTSKISASKRNEFSMIYMDDAVEYIYQLSIVEHLGYIICHISSGNVITQMELAEMIREMMGPGIEIVDNTVGSGYRIVLSSKRYAEILPDQKIFVSYETGVRRVVQYMKRYSDSFLHAEDTGGSWGNRILHTIRTIFRLLVPYFENMVCFIPFFMLNNRAVGSEYFSKLDFYLLYVLLFAIVHGQQQAIFSALLATAGYIFRQMYDQTGFDVLTDYNTYVWMAQLFILGMVIGYMKDQIHFIKNQDQEEINYLNSQFDDIADINDSNVRMKHIFETQIINQKDSLGKIYSVTSGLEQYEPEEVLFYAARVLSELMETKDVAIYNVANGNYARLFSFTSSKAKSMGNSIEYTSLGEMYEDLKEGRVYINRKMDENYPLMASAVYSEDSLQIILMLWGIPWERMNLAESNRLTVVGFLIQNAVVRASRYLEALRQQRYIEGTDVLDTEAFSHLLKAFYEAKDHGLTECSLLKIKDTAAGYKAIAEKIRPKLRQTDYLGISKEEELYVLLPNTDDENAEGVIRRFRECGCESTLLPRESIYALYQT